MCEGEPHDCNAHTIIFKMIVKSMPPQYQENFSKSIASISSVQVYNARLCGHVHLVSGRQVQEMGRTMKCDVQAVSKFLSREVMTSFGIPDKISSDNG